MIEDIDSINTNTVHELKQTRYIEARLEGKTRVESAEIAGFTGREARTPGKLVETAELRRRFQEIAESKGITLHRVADKIGEHLEARCVVDGVHGLASDYKVQQKAIEQFTGLIGMNQSERGATVAVQINFPAGLAEMFGADAKEFEGE
jgi:hypothetical protein